MLWCIYVYLFLCVALFASGGQDNTVLIHSLRPEVEGELVLLFVLVVQQVQYVANRLAKYWSVHM